MSKSAEAFRTISEVADELGVPKHVLRFWEGRFPQIRPMKRGGGRRFYRPEDLELLKGIRHLLHREAYTIKGVQKILRERGVDAVKLHAQDSAAPPALAEVRAEGSPPAGREAPRRSISSNFVAAEISPELKAALAAVVTELKSCRSLLSGREPDRGRKRRAASSR